MEMEKQHNRLVLDRLLNARDLGGFSVPGGGKTKFRRFVRSEVPTSLSQKDIDALLTYPIKTLIDLRSPYECDKCRGTFEDIDSVNVFFLPIVDFTPTSADAAALKDIFKLSLGDFYIFMIKQKKHVFHDIFSVIANAPEGGILYHCAQGKDRTGIISALLLLLVGVSRDDIITSYEISFPLLEPSMAENFARTPKEAHHILRSDRENIIKFLDYFDNEYDGDTEKYLTDIGLSEEDIQKIKDRLLK